MVVQMVSVGEQTGNMDTMLQKIADFYEDEVDAAVDAMTAMLEPAMMVVLAVLVANTILMRRCSAKVPKAGLQTDLGRILGAHKNILKTSP